MSFPTEPVAHSDAEAPLAPRPPSLVEAIRGDPRAGRYPVGDDAPVVVPRDIHPTEDGISLGVTIATAVWLWVALVGVLADQPLQLFSLAGGIAAFTLVHYAVCILFGVMLMSLVHAARREPTLMAGLVFGALLLEVAIVMVTVVAAHTALGALAWLQVFGGSVVAGVVTVAILVRRHRVGSLMRRAHEQS